MPASVELALPSPDGIVDCRIEITETDNGLLYAATILYPHLHNGRIQSKVYEHELNLHLQTGMYYFADPDMVHPKVLLLEHALSDAIRKALN